MTGIREKKKKRTNEDILVAAQKLFIEKGFDNTSIEEIASCAGVGTGTIYNYYKNKADIFVEAIRYGFKDERDKNMSEFSKLEGTSVSEIIFSFIESYVKKVRWVFSKKLARELIKVTVGHMGKKNNLVKKLADEDFKFMEKIEELINELKNQGLVKKTKDSKVLSELVYSALAFEILMFLYEDDITMEKVEDKIRIKIKAIFE